MFDLLLIRLKEWVCVKWGSEGSNMCKMRESVWVISHIFHMVNSDPLTMNGVLGITV